MLPSDVWLTQRRGDSTGTDATAAPGTPAPDSGSGPAPTLTLEGCARDQSQVAVTLVRLRELQGATDVTLDHSTRGDDADAAATPAAAAGRLRGRRLRRHRRQAQLHLPGGRDVRARDRRAAGRGPDRLGGGA